jgi:glutamate/tyrosine decarboxylase-like PLP-dependent enzyme
LHLADSITIDPHKTGYVPYPAGALCYRDNRMKYLVTWTTPYISRGPSAESIGVYGVEGRLVNLLYSFVGLTS